MENVEIQSMIQAVDPSESNRNAVECGVLALHLHKVEFVLVNLGNYYYL